MSVWTRLSAQSVCDLTGIIRLVFIRELVWWRQQIARCVSCYAKMTQFTVSIVAASDTEIQNKVPVNRDGIKI